MSWLVGAVLGQLAPALPPQPPAECVLGQVRARADEPCCYRGQRYSREAARCTGVPTRCPPDFVPYGEGCESRQRVSQEESASRWGHEGVWLDVGPTLGPGRHSSFWWSLGIGAVYHFRLVPLRVSGMLLGGGATYEPEACASDSPGCDLGKRGGGVGGGGSLGLGFAPLSPVDSLRDSTSLLAPWLGARYTLLYLAPPAPGMRYTNDPSGGGQLSLELGNTFVVGSSRSSVGTSVTQISLSAAYCVAATQELRPTLMFSLSYGFGSLFTD